MVSKADSGGKIALVYFGEMISPCRVFVLPERTIAEGCHVGLDVRNRRLKIAKAIGDTTLVEVYEIRSVDDALTLFEYLTTHGARFRSVKII